MLRTITGSPWFVYNLAIRNSTNMPTIKKDIQRDKNSLFIFLKNSHHNYLSASVCSDYFNKSTITKFQHFITQHSSPCKWITPETMKILIRNAMHCINQSINTELSPKVQIVFILIVWKENQYFVLYFHDRNLFIKIKVPN